MSKSSEYRQYAEECLQSARIATSEAARKQFLDLARMWMTAAQQMDDGMSLPLNPENRDTAH
jgi:hypothetical protein